MSLRDKLPPEEMAAARQRYAITRAAEVLWASIDDKGIRGRLFREDCDYLARALDAAGLLVTPAHDAEQQRVGAEAALAYVKAQALDPRQATTEGPLVGRILVAHWCDKAASTGADALEREGGDDAHA